MPVKAYVALGSNLGCREEHLSQAVQRLHAEPEVTVTLASPVYESPAHTVRDDEAQPPFLNAVVEVTTTMHVRDLLDLCHDVERLGGRDRNEAKRWAPRTIDMDVITYDEVVVREPGLSIPHPRIHERRFVLRPLADIAPELWVPHPHEAFVRDLLARCADDVATRRTEHVLTWAGSTSED